MELALDAFEHLRDFLERGGSVLYLITAVICLMWALIFDRLGYLYSEHQLKAHELLAAWAARAERESWRSEKIYEATISRLNMGLRQGMPLIKAFTAICPLLGLLGTVLGMIMIFSVMSVMGVSSPRAVAAGVSTATITTMAGMVGALSGVFPAVFLARAAHRSMQNIRVNPLRVAQAPLSSLARLPSTLRRPLALMAGVLVTVSLLLMMEQMILLGRQAITESRALHRVDFVRIPHEEDVRRREPKPERPPEPHEPPPMETRTQGVTDSVALAVMAPSAPGLGLSLDTREGLGGFVADGEYLPLVKVAPAYPRRAAALMLEGSVVVSFTVTTSGSVRDVTVVESTNKMFEEPAVKAAERFRYKPRVINGQAVEVRGVLHRIQFVLDVLQAERDAKAAAAAKQ